MFGNRRRTSPIMGAFRASGTLSLVLAIAIAGCANLLLTPSDKVVAGRAVATDGDSIRVGNVRFRLEGIDAPELDQTCHRGQQPYPCGETARNALAMILRNEVTCRTAGRDKYKRILATCSVAQVDIGAHMVASGWAVGYGDYSNEERQAQARRAGLWAGTFDLPRDWRRSHPRGQ